MRQKCGNRAVIACLASLVDVAASPAVVGSHSGAVPYWELNNESQTGNGESTVVLTPPEAGVETAP